MPLVDVPSGPKTFQAIPPAVEENRLLPRPGLDLRKGFIYNEIGIFKKSSYLPYYIKC